MTLCVVPITERLCWRENIMENILKVTKIPTIPKKAQRTKTAQSNYNLRYLLDRNLVVRQHTSFSF